MNELSHGELWKQFIREQKESGGASIQKATLEEIRRRVNNDDPHGFQWFYRITRNMILPPFGMRWLNDLYSSNGRWANKAFRGSTKTSTIMESFTAIR